MTPSATGDASDARATAHVARDFLASVVVFLVALPLCMGIAIASGAPPAAGLVTGIVGGLVVGALQGAPLQVSGPAAGLSVIVWDLVRTRGLGTLGVIVLVAGVLQFAAGLARAGRWFRAVPPSVIYGMLGGIGVLIFASQFHVMIDDVPRGRGLANIVTIPRAIWKGLVAVDGKSHHRAAQLGVLTLVILSVWNAAAPKRLKVIPGALVAVTIATIVAAVFAFPVRYVAVPDSLLGTVRLPTVQSLRAVLDPSVLGAAAMLAVIASAETLLCATAVDRIHNGPRTDYNRELVAQGVGNVLCGLLGALPMTGVIVRSSANVEAGGRTRLAAILHGGWLLLFVMALPFVLRRIPVASLAALLVFTGYKLVNPAAIRQLRRYGRSEVVIYGITVVAIVATDLLKGVIVGIALAVGKLLWTLARAQLTLEDDPTRRLAVLHLRGSATFLQLPYLAKVLESVPADREMHIRFDDLDYLDHASIEVILAWEKQHIARGGRVVVEWDALERVYRDAATRLGAPTSARTESSELAVDGARPERLVAPRAELV